LDDTTLRTKTVPQLKQIAKDLKIYKYYSLNKKELLHAITQINNKTQIVQQPIPEAIIQELPPIDKGKGRLVEEITNLAECDPVEGEDCGLRERCNINTNRCVLDTRESSSRFVKTSINGRNVIGTQAAVDNYLDRAKERSIPTFTFGGNDEDIPEPTGPRQVPPFTFGVNDKGDIVTQKEPNRLRPRTIVREDTQVMRIPQAPILPHITAGLNLHNENIEDVLNEIQEPKEETVENLTVIQKDILRCLNLL